MKVLTINIDSKNTNLALEKVKKYHIDRGDEVMSDMPLARRWANKIYVSCLFSWNREKCTPWEGVAEIGGPGYDYIKRLPPEIDAVKVKNNIGYTTRGCIRQCWFCVVWRAEGNVRVVGDIYDLWDGYSNEITLMDNNILALPAHFKKICGQIREENLKVDFNQGLDIRLLTDSAIDELRNLRHKQYRFAWDFDDFSLVNNFERLQGALGKCFIYVLSGQYSFDTDLKKLEILKSIGHTPYLMRLEKVRKEKRYIRLAQWVNQPWAFKKYTFLEFCKIRGSGEEILF